MEPHAMGPTAMGPHAMGPTAMGPHSMAPPAEPFAGRRGAYRYVGLTQTAPQIVRFFFLLAHFQVCFALQATLLFSYHNIDAFSSFPIDSIILAVTGDSDSGGSTLRMIKMLRLVKLVRILRASRIIARWEAYIGARAKTRQRESCTARAPQGLGAAGL